MGAYWRPRPDENPGDVRFSVEPFWVQGRRHDPVWVIPVRGEIDGATTPALEDALRTARQEGEGTVVLDLCEAGWLDPVGLHVVAAAQRRLTRAKRRLVIACPEGAMLSVLEVTGLSELVEVHPSLEAALAAEPAGPVE
jgi:anti-sigma B factor antagonist